MNYDFESIPNRSNCGSVKWESASGASIEQVPLSTADMEFPMAPEIAEGMAEYARNSIYGYTKPTQPYYDAVCGWMSRKHNWETKSEWIVTTPGVVYALGLTIEALSAPGDSVIVITPVYYPFDLTVLAKGRNIEYTTRFPARYSLQEKQVQSVTSRLHKSLKYPYRIQTLNSVQVRCNCSHKYRYTYMPLFRY